jgi:hypothetical protein
MFNKDRLILADTVHSINRLLFYGGIPPAIHLQRCVSCGNVKTSIGGLHHEDVVCRRQIEANPFKFLFGHMMEELTQIRRTSSLQGYQEYLDLSAWRGKLLYSLGSLFLRHGPV